MYYHDTTYPLSPQLTYDMTTDYRLQQNRQTLTNYKKADWTQFIKDTESNFAQTTIPTNIHTANIIFTNIILMADKHNIPKRKMHSNCRLLPDHIVYKITQRNNIRRANTCDPGNIERASTSRSLVRIPVSNKSLYHATQKKNHGYSTSISMPTTRALIRAGIDSDVDQHRGHVCSKAATTRGVV